HAPRVTPPVPTAPRHRPAGNGDARGIAAEHPVGQPPIGLPRRGCIWARGPMHGACTGRQPVAPTLALSGRPTATKSKEGDDMYLHPEIHAELSRQRQRELSRLALEGERGSRSLPGRQAAVTLGVLLV